MNNLTLDGKRSAVRPNYPVVVNGYKVGRSININGLPATGSMINGLVRPPIGMGCVLYLPLWHPKLSIPSGGAFSSLDNNAHVCTVTGAVWGWQGRLFAGDDDLISVASAASLNPGTSDIVLAAWFKTTDLGWSKIIGKNSTSAVGNAVYDGMTLVISGTGTLALNFRSTADSDSDVGVIGATDAHDGAWHFGVANFDRSGNEELFLDCVSQGTASIAYAVARDITYSQPLALGVRLVDRPPPDDRDIWFTGTIGEVFMYKGRPLTLGEIQNLYLATKWRYR